MGLKIIEQKPIILKIKDVGYRVNLKISLGFLEIILDEEKSEKEYKKRIANALLNAIELDKGESKPSVEDILGAGGIVLQQYIEAVIKSDEVLDDYYAKRAKTEQNYEKFCNVIGDYTSGILNEFSGIMAPLISNIQEPMQEIGKVFTDCFKPIIEISKQFSDTIEKTNDFAESIRQSVTVAFDNFSKYQESVLKKVQEIAETYGEIDWEGLKEQYQTWGEYSWTIIGEAPLDFFANTPEDQVEADTLGMEFFDRDGLNNLFENLRKSGINKKDIESAIFCFEHEQYKACSMLLCAMIEAPFIKIQPADSRRRSVGKGAVEKFDTQLKDTSLLEKQKSIYLQTESTLSFLRILFEHGNGFKSEPKQLNRNFLSHGMTKREVDKIDCVKLFLGLYNTMEILDHCGMNEELFD